MRMLSKILAGTAAAAATVALTAGPALADPPSGTTPAVTAAVGTGSNTTQYLLDGLSYNFDHKNPSATEKLYSWDAVNPDTLAIGDNIVTKKGCAAIARPDGSGAGITQLDANVVDPSNNKYFCEDYARSSRARESTDPPFAPGGVGLRVAGWGRGDLVRPQRRRRWHRRPGQPDRGSAREDLRVRRHELEAGRRPERADRGLPTPDLLGHQVVLPYRAGWRHHPDHSGLLRDRRHHQRPEQHWRRTRASTRC